MLTMLRKELRVLLADRASMITLFVSPILFITCMLGLQPDPVTGRLTADAVLPEACQRLELRGVEALGRKFDINVRGGHAEVRESA